MISFPPARSQILGNFVLKGPYPESRPKEFTFRLYDYKASISVTLPSSLKGTGHMTRTKRAARESDPFKTHTFLMSEKITSGPATGGVIPRHPPLA